MKILDITGNPFSKELNNGKTHEALFSSFEKEELCQLYTRPVDNGLIDFDFCHSYYCVSDFDVLKRLTLRSRICGIEVSNSDAVANQGNDYITFSDKKISSYPEIIRLLRDLMWHTNVWKNKNLEQWLFKEKPDLVFVDGGGECFLFDIALYIAKKIHVPLVSYYTDDYLITPLLNGFVSKIRHKRLDKTLKKVVGCSSLCYAIGEEMAEEYGKYFHKEFGYIMNSIAVMPYVEKLDSSKRITISYFGSLGLNRGRMIGRLAKILGSEVEIKVYTFSHLTQEDSEWLNAQGVSLNEGVKGEEFHNAVYDSDILLHVESDDDDNRAFTRLAVSTKIPEYLMHSRSVLGFGPTEVASMRLLSKNDVGVVVSSEVEDQDIYRAVSVLFDKSCREEYSKKGYKYACDFFDREKNANRFKKQIEQIINGK